MQGEARSGSSKQGWVAPRRECAVCATSNRTSGHVQAAPAKKRGCTTGATAASRARRRRGAPQTLHGCEERGGQGTTSSDQHCRGAAAAAGPRRCGPPASPLFATSSQGKQHNTHTRQATRWTHSDTRLHAHHTPPTRRGWGRRWVRTRGGWLSGGPGLRARTAAAGLRCRARGESEEKSPPPPSTLAV